MSTQLDGLRRFVAHRDPAPLPAGGGGRVVVVGSGKGGVGTSTIAALLALVASAQGRNVLLVDAAESLGVQHLLFGVPAERSLGALRGGETVPRELLIPIGERLSLLPGGAAAAEAQFSPAERRALFQRLSPLYAEFDLVVADGGSRLDSVLAACGSARGRLLAVTAADRIALAATHALVKAVATRLGDIAVDVLVNRQEEAGAVATFAELRTAAEHFLRRKIGFAGAVPDDGCIAAGVAAGMPIHDAASASPAAAAIQPIAERLFGELAANRHATGAADGRSG